MPWALCMLSREEGKGDITAHLAQEPAVATCNLGSLSLSEPHTQDKPRSGQGQFTQKHGETSLAGDSVSWPTQLLSTVSQRKKEDRRQKLEAVKRHDSV